MKYQVEIIAFGPLVEELLENDMMIIFNENAPAGTG